MATRKKGSELVFNIQWKSKPDNGGEKSNIIGMYDTPATTQNFETFKSYLLKNSGVAEKDVKVIFLTDNGVQWVIESQEWFEIALCAFRLKARLGEIIFLKLDTVSTSPHHQMARNQSIDVETQFDHHSIPNNFDSPPEWFLTYMKQFKRDVVEEVTIAVSSNVIANSKDKETNPPVVICPKKVKPEPSKRSRRHMIPPETPLDPIYLKNVKFERKIESKLDKLDAKTKKIKELRQALINKIDNEDHRHSRRPHIFVDVEPTTLMDGSVARSGVVPHMVGGETYLHTWEIKNNGHLPWTSKTELRLTWGSADLKPSVNFIRCPPLQPGEKGTVAVRFQIPTKPGQYESYWNFYERDVRFGQGVSCAIIVDGPICYLPETASSKKPKIEEKQQQVVFSENLPSNTPDPEKMELTCCPYSAGDQASREFTRNETVGWRFAEGGRDLPPKVMDLSNRMQDLKIVGTPHVDSDSDWETVGSGGRKPKNTDDNFDDFDPVKSNKYGINENDLIVDLSTIKQETQPVEEIEKEEVKAPEEENSNSNDDNNNNGTSVNNNSSGESICEIASEASDLSSGYDIVNAPICEEREEASGYVYITVDGNKLPVPKHILRPDFLEHAEEAPGPLNSEDEEKPAKIEEKPAKIEEKPSVSAIKTASQDPKQIEYTKEFMNMMEDVKNDTFADANPGQHARVFVFPQDNPGFEFLYYPKGIASTKEVGEPCPNFSKISVYPDPVGESGTPKQEQKPSKESDDKVKSPEIDYSWARSETQYTFPDMQSACAASEAAHLRCDPYGPLDQSRPSSSQSTASTGVRYFRHVPNYQQSVPKPADGFKQEVPTAPSPQQPPTAPPAVAPVHILPENLVSGAVNVASSAINTARSVINMIVPPRSEGGKWVNGHWVSDPESARAKNLCILTEMGFWDTDLNATLLARYNDDVARVVSELLQ